MTLEERRKIITDQCKFHIDKPKEIPGGQHCGIQTYPTVLEHDELQIKISIGYYRQNYKNKQMALDIFDLALFEIIK
jgi:hypothetical protein